MFYALFMHFLSTFYAFLMHFLCIFYAFFILAGAPPPRVASVERRRHPGLAVIGKDNLLAELEKEVEEPEAVAQQLAPQAASSDPVQQVLLAQLQQNAMLLQKLIAPKHADPIIGALSSGSDGGSASGSGSGVKGCLAWEMFIKASQDLDALALAVRKNALRELGLDPSREVGSLMKKYMERRMPVAEHKTLALVATLCAEGWQTAFASQNVELMGALAKILIFVEQTAMDSGKMQLSWLLTGHQEPPWQLLTTHRKMPGLQPFSRLAAPSWISANLAYLKELDYMETRVLSVGKQQPAEKAERDPEAKPKPRPKGKKGAGKGAKNDVTHEAPAA